jgi:hypothetical protein
MTSTCKGLLCLLWVAAGTAQAAADFSWMQGSWCGETNDTLEEETWLAPRGGLLLGVHRDTRGGIARSFEFLRIEQRADGAAYVAQPGGRPPVRFDLVRSGARSATFENLQHDFPKRIHYELADGPSLVAWIEGAREGEKRKRWSWKPCPAARR